MASRTRLEVSFPLSGLSLNNLLGARIRMSDYNHDVAIVDLQGATPLTWYTGDPVRITWGSDVQATEFVGYLDHAATTDTGVQVVCVGASYPMKNAAQNIWTQVTADEVVTEIADRYQLDVSLTPSDWLFKQIVQSAESDWQLLVRLAKSIGYSVFVHRTQLLFHPRYRDFLAYRASAPVFSASTQLSNFRPVSGIAVPTDGSVGLATRRLTSVDQNGDLLVTTDYGAAPLAGSYSFTPAFTQMSQAVVDSEAEASATLAAERELNRWHINATAVLRGDIRVRQDMPVYLDGVATDVTGYWVVLEAEHRIVPNAETDYTIGVRLGRDSQGESPDGPSQPAPDRALSPTSGISDVTSSRLLNGRWIASRTDSAAIIDAEVPDFVRDRLADRG